MSAIKFRETLANWAALADTDLIACADVSEDGEFVAVTKAMIAAAFAAANHNHTGVYSPVGHDHSGTYSPVGHDHSGVYSPVGHDHSGVYSPVGHDHDEAYDAIGAAATALAQAEEAIENHALEASGVHGITAWGATLIQAENETEGAAIFANTLAGKGANTFTGAQTIASGTLNASAPALNITQTWNNAGATFTAALVNITNTASNAASKLLDLQVGGTSMGFVGTRPGWFTSGSSVTSVPAGAMGVGPWSTALGFFAGGSVVATMTTATLDLGGVDLRLSGANSGLLVSGGTHIAAFRNAANAQTVRTYHDATASVTEYVDITWSGDHAVLQTAAGGSGIRPNLSLDSANRSAYIGTPTVEQIRDILISFGLMAAS